METHVIEADDRLAQVFSHFYTVCQGANAPMLLQQLLPNYELLLVLNFGPELPIWLRDEAYTIQRIAIIGPQPNPVADDIVLEPALLADLWAQLADKPTLYDRTRCFSEYAINYLSPVDTTMQPLLDTIPHFRRTLVDPIKAVAQQHSLSTRTLQLRFQNQLGYSAKKMIRFVRFKKLLAQLIKQQPTPPDWADLVVTHGYHDQSHLIRDVQFYTGLSPTLLVKQLADQTLCISQPGKFY